MPHCPSFDPLRWPQRRWFLVVFDAVCSSVLPYFFWVSRYVLSLVFNLLLCVSFKGQLLLACHLSLHSHTPCSPCSCVHLVCIQLVEAALTSSPAFPTFRVVFGPLVLMLLSIMFCHFGCFSLSTFSQSCHSGFPPSQPLFVPIRLLKAAHISWLAFPSSIPLF